MKVFITSVITKFFDVHCCYHQTGENKNNVVKSVQTCTVTHIAKKLLNWQSNK
jgi:hypothetical protein